MIYEIAATMIYAGIIGRVIDRFLEEELRDESAIRRAEAALGLSFLFFFVMPIFFGAVIANMMEKKE